MQPDPEPDPARVLISVCTYNERENIERLLAEIRRHAPQADILVVDDNSPDGTGDLADSMAAQDPAIRVLHRRGERGLGSATLAAFREALAHGYDFILNLDADFSHDPRSLPALLARKENADVVIGSRYVAGGRIEGWPLLRHLMSRCINLYSRWLLWLSPRDCSGAFRCYRTSKLAELDLERVRALGYAFQEEILYRCRRIGCRFEEVPIVFENRQAGDSKINIREMFSALVVILCLSAENVLRVPVRR